MLCYCQLFLYLKHFPIKSQLSILVSFNSMNAINLRIISLEKEMATHSGILVWRIPWIERGAWCATDYGVTKGQTQLSV